MLYTYVCRHWWHALHRCVVHHNVARAVTALLRAGEVVAEERTWGAVDDPMTSRDVVVSMPRDDDYE